MKRTLLSVLLAAGAVSGAYASQVWVLPGSDPVSVSLPPGEGSFDDAITFLGGDGGSLVLNLPAAPGVTYSSVMLDTTPLTQASDGSWSTGNAGLALNGPATLHLQGVSTSGKSLLTLTGGLAGASTSVGGGDQPPPAVPEPATWAMGLAGLSALGWIGRRRRGR